MEPVDLFFCNVVVCIDVDCRSSELRRVSPDSSKRGNNVYVLVAREAYGSLGVGVDSIEKRPRVEDRQRGLQGSQPTGHCKLQGWDNPSRR